MEVVLGELVELGNALFTQVRLQVKDTSWRSKVFVPDKLGLCRADKHLVKGWALRLLVWGRSNTDCYSALQIPRFSRFLPEPPRLWTLRLLSCCPACFYRDRSSWNLDLH